MEHATTHYLETAATDTRPRTVVVLSYNAARTLRKALSTEASRPVFHRVHVRPDIVETTNGHILFRVPTVAYRETADGDMAPSEFGPFDFPEWTFPGDVLKNLRTKQCLVLDVDTGEMETREDPENDGRPRDVLARLETVATSTQEGGYYPNTDQVIPRYDGPEWCGTGRDRRDGERFRVAFSGKYLKALGEAALYMERRGGPGRVVFTMAAPERAAVVEMPNGAHGVVMPLRIL